ncbi:hypothetical protein DIR46_18345 [Massilia oculi]|uniref:Uncharacterized protein n=1 Tax=Massilia oculi TaxID=945844 RepID=A0A2S2DMX1_9BURK|nr:hypothetical protein DIR46_18345 [Massilia oculi]
MLCTVLGLLASLSLPAFAQGDVGGARPIAVVAIANGAARRLIADRKPPGPLAKGQVFTGYRTANTPDPTHMVIASRTVASVVPAGAGGLARASNGVIDAKLYPEVTQCIRGFCPVHAANGTHPHDKSQQQQACRRSGLKLVTTAYASAVHVELALMLPFRYAIQ